MVHCWEKHHEGDAHMDRKLTFRETLLISTMLFGLFFGAGNLIFPVFMGRMAGQAVWKASLGFLLTGVTLPLLSVAAIGLTRSNGLMDLSAKVSRPYSLFFTCTLYLTIGPCFAIPRCATVPFTVGVSTLVGDGNQTVALLIFSLVFFALVLLLSLRPGKILTYVGRILTPVFLLFLAVLVIAALTRPMVSLSETVPLGDYESSAFFTGFLDGYNTMDALAGLAFGIVVVTAIRSLGVTEPRRVALSTAGAGIFSCLFMGLIYLAVTLAGVQSRGLAGECQNGGEVLAVLAHHYFGKAGALLLTVIVTLACFKTSVGLVTSCAETFVALFPKGPGYKVWAVIFSVVSFLIANLGLTAIIAYSVPVLMLLYPLAITLSLMGITGRWFGHDRRVYGTVTGFTLVAALPDLIGALPGETVARLHLLPVIDFATACLPLFKLGVGWLCPAVVGLFVGLIWRRIHLQKTAQS